MRVSLRLAVRSHRLHLWPSIVATAAAMSPGVAGGVASGLQLGVALALLASAGFVLNDLWDRRADSANAARRLEQAGLATRVVAGLSASCALVAALMVARWAGPGTLALILWASLGLFLYTTVLRRVLLGGTLTAAMLATAPVWAPLALWGVSSPMQLRLVWVMGILVVGREIMLDVKDVVGDREANRCSVPVVFGRDVAVWAACVLHLVASALFLAVVLGFVTEGSFGRGVSAVVLSLAFVGLLVLPLLVVLRRGASAGRLRAYVAGSYVAMGLFPIILWLSLRVPGVP